MLSAEKLTPQQASRINAQGQSNNTVGVFMLRFYAIEPVLVGPFARAVACKFNRINLTG